MTHFPVTVIGRIREQDEADCGFRIPKPCNHPNLENGDKRQVNEDRIQARSEEGKAGRPDDLTFAHVTHFPATVIGRIREQDEADCGFRIPKPCNHPNLENGDKRQVNEDRIQARSEEGKAGRPDDLSSAHVTHFPATVIGRIRDEHEPNCRFRKGLQ